MFPSALNRLLFLTERCSDNPNKAQCRRLFHFRALALGQSTAGCLDVSREMGQEARLQKGSQGTQPPQTPGRLGPRGRRGGEGVKEPHSGAWTPAGLHVFISRVLQLSAPQLRDHPCLQEGNRNLLCLCSLVPLACCSKGARRAGGWQVWERMLAQGRQTGITGKT